VNKDSKSNTRATDESALLDDRVARLAAGGSILAGRRRVVKRPLRLDDHLFAAEFAPNWDERATGRVLLPDHAPHETPQQAAVRAATASTAANPITTDTTTTRGTVVGSSPLRGPRRRDSVDRVPQHKRKNRDTDSKLHDIEENDDENDDYDDPYEVIDDDDHDHDDMDPFPSLKVEASDVPSNLPEVGIMEDTMPEDKIADSWYLLSILPSVS
jgi:hypothetical protein